MDILERISNEHTKQALDTIAVSYRAGLLDNRIAYTATGNNLYALMADYFADLLVIVADLQSQY